MTYKGTLSIICSLSWRHMTWQSAFLLLSVVSAQEIPIGDSVIPHTKLKEGRKECEGRKDRGKDRKIVKKGHPISALPMEDRKDCEGGREGRKEGSTFSASQS